VTERTSRANVPALVILGPPLTLHPVSSLLLRPSERAWHERVSTAFFTANGIVVVALKFAQIGEFAPIDLERLLRVDASQTGFIQ
jgi:hypothetical protein